MGIKPFHTHFTLGSFTSRTLGQGGPSLASHFGYSGLLGNGLNDTFIFTFLCPLADFSFSLFLFQSLSLSFSFNKKQVGQSNNRMPIRQDKLKQELIESF